MPKISKPARRAAARQERNRSVRSFTKTCVTKAESLIATNEAGAASDAVSQAISALDKAAKKGVIHPNNAARRKSRLMKKLNTAKS